MSDKDYPHSEDPQVIARRKTLDELSDLDEELFSEVFRKMVSTGTAVVQNGKLIKDSDLYKSPEEIEAEIEKSKTNVKEIK